MKILVVDDVALNCRVLSALLAPHGQIVAVNTGHEAVDAFRHAWAVNAPFNLICLDIMLPDLDGVKVLQVLRKMEEAMKVEAGQRVRILMVSALMDSKVILHARESGCDGYILKPVTMKTLEQSLKHMGLIANEPG